MQRFRHSVNTELLHVNTPEHTGTHRPVELGEDDRSVCIEMRTGGGKVTITCVMMRQRPEVRGFHLQNNCEKSRLSV